MPASVLFIPVSGPRGMGEYARSVAIADALMQRWPDTHVHFVVSRAAPYAAQVPYPATLLPASPTFHSREVGALIRELKPTVVVFDNAGRTAQLRAASRAGARIVFISSRPRQRRKAFRWQWLRLIDEHFIAYPEFIAGPVTFYERLKLRVSGRGNPRFLDALLPEHRAQLAADVMRRFDLRPEEYVLVVPGGGTAHPGAENAPAVFAGAARGMAQRGYTTVLVGSESREDHAEPGALRVAPRLPMDQMCELIRGARLVISNGGDTLLQVLACRRLCLAVPVAGDQAHRIACCVAEGLVKASRLERQALEEDAVSLLQNAPWRSDLDHRFSERHIANGMEAVLAVLGELLGVHYPASGRGPGY